MSNGTNMGTAVVTGASSGIGKVYADRLAQRGYDLLLVARRADKLNALAKDLEQRHNVKARTIAADLTNTAELEKIAQQIGQDTSVTFLVNNAGTNKFGPFEDLQTSDITRLIDLNITALTLLTAAVLRGFRERNRGTIVNIGSVNGYRSYPGTLVYSGTKAYVLNFTQGLQEELAKTAIAVQVVTPAATESEIWEIQGWGLSNLPPEVVMTTENCVDASLRGLDAGEKITSPSVEDAQLIANFEASQAALFGGAMSGKPASRYDVGVRQAGR